MKKIAVVALSLVMVVCLTLIAIAGPGKFLNSPSRNAAPEIVSFTPASEDCYAYLVVTPYAERNTLDDATRAKLEEAYDQIANKGDAFVKILKELSEQKGIPVAELSVSDLFDISYYSCEHHANHKGFTITLKAETIKNFVGLVHLMGDEWEIIEVSEVNEAENTITFYVEDLSPFAIVVDNGSGDKAPQTGDNTMVYLGVMAVAACGLVLVLVSGKKRKV